MMKRLLPLLLLMLFLSRLSAQDNLAAPEWDKNSSSFSLYGTLGFGVHANLSYNYMHYTGTVFTGLSTGLSLIYFDGFTVAPHATWNLMIGKKNNHAELKLGIAYPFDDYVTYIPIIPVISLSYRHQKPDGNTFFRTGISTGGISVGYGWLFN